MSRRDAYLRLDDDALLADCAFDRFRGSGRGGQKKNKTSSAVRLRHTPTGLAGQCEDSRSQSENKARALRRLRAALAFELREEVALEDYAAPAELRAALASPRHGPAWLRSADYLCAAAQLLDLVAAAGGIVADAAAALATTTSALSRFVADDERLLAAVNQIRARRGLRALR